MQHIIKYIKTLNWKFLIGFGVFCLLCAIANNLRVSDDKSIEWIGSQEILQKPEDVL
ncbi:MAG: hypothetical protein UIH18_01180 [Fibrobacteraceae bacterium]|nr:hypothetical protein [Fibrobacteraceae bacterium]